MTSSATLSPTSRILRRGYYAAWARPAACETQPNAHGTCLPRNRAAPCSRGHPPRSAPSLEPRRRGPIHARLSTKLTSGGQIAIPVDARETRLADLPRRLCGFLCRHCVRDQVLADIHAFRPAKMIHHTHLRAHETRHDLVCRLLLEKKK